MSVDTTPTSFDVYRWAPARARGPCLASFENRDSAFGFARKFALEHCRNVVVACPHEPPEVPHGYMF
ncbi:MAG: hypothetical protein AAGA38_03010 [Pseudomonadota bacterium]